MKKPAAMSEQEKELKRQYAMQFSSVANNLPEFNLTTFLSLQDLIESKDLADYKKSGMSGLKHMAGGLVGGIAASTIFTSANPFNFLKKPLWIRLPVRLVLFAVPMVAMMHLGSQNIMRIEQLHNKYNTRLERFRMTQDFNHMDPNGVLFKEFLEKTHK